MTTRLLATTSAAAALVLGLTACGGGEQPAAEDGKVPVVASTNVWASVVTAVGGDKVSVKSLIDQAAGDPHSYEATAEDAADVRDAKLLLSNGGGYDEFFGKMAEQAPDARKLVAFDISGKGEQAEQRHATPEKDTEHAERGEHGEHEGHEGHDHGAVNEHVWYDLPTVGKVADQVATQLGELRPADKQAFTANAATFKAGLTELTGEVERIAATSADAKILATEPVAHYLLDAAKLMDATPPAFAEAIENETDVPVAAQQQVEQLVSTKEVRAVVNNVQTQTPVTEKVLGVARQAGVPVVDVTETLPEGQTDYIAWMRKEVTALSGALSTT